MKDLELSRPWVRFADRHRVAVVVLCTLAALVGGYGTARLYGDLRPDMSELLPARSRSARDLETVTKRVGGYAEEAVVLSGADAMTLQLFADDLAARLEGEPKDVVRYVEYRADDLVSFFKSRLLLFPSQADLVTLRDTLGARIRWEKAHANPLFVSLGDDPAPPLEALVERLAGEKKGMLGRFPEGYFMGEVPGRHPGEKLLALAMLVRMGGQPDRYDDVVRVDRAIKKAVAELDPRKYAPGLHVAYGGYVASNILEHDALAEDLVIATVLVLLAVALVIGAYYRSWKAIPAVGIPLIAGTLATFGLAEIFVGHLNSNTAFLGSIVVGNGINVGLILFARYVEERRRGHAALAAMETAVESTWLATLTAALAAGIAYASLMSTDFRGFNQFGLIGGIGMTLSWIFAYVMTPALVLLLERAHPLVRGPGRPARPIFTEAVARVVERAPRATLVVAALVSAGSLALIARFARDPIENDFTKLRDTRALLPDGPAWWDQRVTAIFGEHLTPTVLLCKDDAEARQVSAAIDAKRRSTPNSTLGSVASIGTFVPRDQAAKLPVIAQIRALATPETLALLPPDQRATVTAAIPAADLAPFGFADLPATLRRQLTEADGRTGTPVLVYPAGGVDVWNGRDVLRAARELRSIPLPRPDIPMASPLLVFADVLAAIGNDGPRATGLSLAGVVILVLLAFGLHKRSARSLSDAGWVLASLALGVVWFGGLAGILNLKLNMLNFIALPITFGIGVDYATNIFQRRRLDHEASIASCLRTTGGAVALCSLTTIIGYSSLLVARNQALISFGLLADFGELACLSAALFALPALLRWRELSRAPRCEPERAAAG